MAKAPIPGYVKTRLIPEVGEQEAAEIYRSMLFGTAEKMLTANLCPVQIWCQPDPSHGDFLELERRGASLHQQTGEDLGSRMHHAVESVFDSFRPAVVIGCDCPLLTSEMIETTLVKLAGQGHDAVVGPVEDGGYYLLGLKNCEPRLFHGINWGTPKVREETVQRLRSLNWNWFETDTLWDLDRPADLIRYRQINFTR